MILPLDRASWHLSDTLEAPEGIHLLPLPAYSPELQPAERLWPLINESLVTKAFNGIVAVEEMVKSRCRELLQQQELFQGLTSYYWWPRVKGA